MPGTLGDLVAGFQGGYNAVQDGRRKRKLNKAIDYELEGMHQERNAKNAGIARLGYGDEMSAPDFQMPETYGERLVGKVKSFFSGGTGQQPTAAIDPAAQPAGPQESGATTFGTEENRYVQPQRYNDGGAVRHMANGGRSLAPQQGAGMRDHRRSTASTALPVGYADGGKAETEEEKRARFNQAIPRDPNGDVETSGGGFMEGVKDVGRNIGGNTRRRFSEWAPEGHAADQAVLDAEGAANTGSAIRSNMAEGARGLGQVGMGLLEDTGVAPIAEGIGGFLGYGTDKAEEEPRAGKAIATGDKEAAVTSAVAAQPVGAGPDTQTPQAKNAAQPAGPPDEIVDFSQVRDIMPEDLPNQTVKDWEDERRFWAAQAIALGNDPEAAMQAVTERQMRGFQSYGQQATQMLINGDATGAARAMYAAYQYFPNGADVKFGVQKGVDGTPVLIGMGTDEETGEPLKEGKPVVVTKEVLAAQMENMSNPGAWNTWVKDQHGIAQEMREYAEVTKPTAESNARYRDRAGKAALNNSAAALNRSAATGGLDQGDNDRANAAFLKAVEMESFENEEQADFMGSLMAQIYQRHGGNVQYPTVIEDVRKAVRSGDFTELDQKYGQ